jgi:molybdopterin molybdotransferase
VETTLTELTVALARLDDLLVGPVDATCLPIAAALGRVLAEPLVAGADLPPAAEASEDGLAVRAASLDGAGPYAPVVLARPEMLAAGEALPPGTDTVVALRDVTRRGEIAELTQPIAPGDGVRPAGRDIASGQVWRPAGAVLTAWDLPVLAALGITRVAVRAPRIVLLPTGASLTSARRPDSLSPGLHALLVGGGALARMLPPVAGRAAIVAALRRAAADADLLVVTGGTGDGPEDESVAALAQAGRVVVRGIGLRPGMTAAIGAVGAVPVIVLPGRPADALGTWLVLGAPALRALANALPPPRRRVGLAGKLVSTPGLAELALLRRVGEDGEMLALCVGEPTLCSFSAADGWLVVPAGREGYDLGTCVDCMSL